MTLHLFKYVFHSGRDKVFVANVSKISTFNENVLDSKWWRRLVNAYEVKADMVSLQFKNCVIHTGVSTSEARFSQWGTIQIYLLSLPFRQHSQPFCLFKKSLYRDVIRS